MIGSDRPMVEEWDWIDHLGTLQRKSGTDRGRDWISHFDILAMRSGSINGKDWIDHFGSLFI